MDPTFIIYSPPGRHDIPFLSPAGPLSCCSGASDCRTKPAETQFWASWQGVLGAQEGKLRLCAGWGGVTPLRPQQPADLTA